MNHEELTKLLAKLEAYYGQEVKIIGDEAREFLFIEPLYLLKVLEFLKTDESCQFNMLRNLTAVDYKEYMEIVYHLYSLPLKHTITVKTHCGIEDSEVSSVTALWPAANFQEREVYDLLGVKFAGHPDMRRILLRDEFEGHPLRKTYTTLNSGEKR